MEELYREQILEHYKRPHNFGAVENPDLEFDFSRKKPPKGTEPIRFVGK